ncbi:MAG: hypothetical protein Q9169_002238 [Polycauliona sp. 2 TL-2023]
MLVSTGNLGGSVRVTDCGDGSYCCGSGTKASSCCANGNGVFLANNGQTTNVNPSSTSSTASTTSSPTSAPQTTTSNIPPGTVTKTTEKTKNNTGAIAGGVVGGLVAAALIVAAAIWFFKRWRSQEMGEKGPAIPYATSSKPGYFSEMEGANAPRMELPAPLGHEMPTEVFRDKKYPMHELPTEVSRDKKYPVHELQ